jgi:hypothetical protein
MQILFGYMKLYRFSPIKGKVEFLQAVEHIHFSCYALCKQSLGTYLPNAGNMGIFCHYDDEYVFLTTLRKQLTEPSEDVNQKYFRLHEPIIIPARGDVPKTTYTHLYIRKPDPYRHHAGDVDFFLDPAQYRELKQMLLEGTVIKGIRVFDRADLDMLELFDPDVDALGYISTKTMAEKVRVKQL